VIPKFRQPQNFQLNQLQEVITSNSENVYVHHKKEGKGDSALLHKKILPHANKEKKYITKVTFKN